MKNVTLLLAARYLVMRQKEKNISFMIRMCFLGICIGTAALMLTLIITHGFEKTIHEKMQGINASLLMRSSEHRINPDAVRAVIKKDPYLQSQIVSSAGSSIGQIIIEHKTHQSLLFLKGVEPAAEEATTALASKITETVSDSHHLVDLLQDNHILIGSKTAQAAGIAVGDSLSILIPEHNGKRKILLTKKTVIVAGIFTIGLDEYDQGFALCSHDFFSMLFEKEGVDTIALKLCPVFSPFPFFSAEERQEQEVKEHLQSLFPSFSLYSWKELYAALVSSLKLEKYVMFFIIALITLVASMNMISLLFITIQHKRRDIAILKTMGASNGAIRSIFVTIGMAITVTGSLAGLTLAAIAGSILEHYPFIELPDIYYVSHLPARMEPSLFFLVFCATVLIGLCATLLATRQTQQIKVVEVLRSE